MSRRAIPSNAVYVAAYEMLPSSATSRVNRASSMPWLSLSASGKSVRSQTLDSGWKITSYDDATVRRSIPIVASMSVRVSASWRRAWVAASSAGRSTPSGRFASTKSSVSGSAPSARACSRRRSRRSGASRRAPRLTNREASSSRSPPGPSAGAKVPERKTIVDRCPSLTARALMTNRSPSDAGPCTGCGTIEGLKSAAASTAISRVKYAPMSSRRSADRSATSGTRCAIAAKLVRSTASRSVCRPEYPVRTSASVCATSSSDSPLHRATSPAARELPGALGSWPGRKSAAATRRGSRVTMTPVRRSSAVWVALPLTVAAPRAGPRAAAW